MSRRNRRYSSGGPGAAEGTCARGASEGPRFAPYVEGLRVHGHTTDRVTQIIREAVLDGVLAPSTWLRESELARELSVSRTPVREALRRLAVEGLITITAHQGAVVTPMTTDDVLEVYVVREKLEGLAARLAATHRSGWHIDQLGKLMDQMHAAAEERDYPQLASLNLAFHKVIREASGNAYLDRFLTQVEHAVRRFGRTTFAMPGRASEALEEHRQIAGAVSAGDAETSERLAAKHMRRARELRISALFE